MNMTQSFNLKSFFGPNYNNAINYFASFNAFTIFSIPQSTTFFICTIINGTHLINSFFYFGFHQIFSCLRCQGLTFLYLTKPQHIRFPIRLEPKALNLITQNILLNYINEATCMLNHLNVHNVIMV